MTKYTTAKQAVRVGLAQHGRTQEWLAVQIGMDQTQVSRTLSGYRLLTAEFAAKVKAAIGVDLRPFVTTPSERRVS